MTDKIPRLMQAIVRAEDALANELRRSYPVGSLVYVVLADNQDNPSEATVIGHAGGRFGRIRVRLTRTPKRAVRDVSYGKFCR